MSEAMSWVDLRSRRRELRVTLWVVQIALAAFFGMIGAMQLSWPMSALSAVMYWPGEVPEAVVRFGGFVELIGAIGLVLPAATRVLPQLTWMAAAGLSTMMVVAALYDGSILDFELLPLVALLSVSTWFVAWGRWKAAPIAPRVG